MHFHALHKVSGKQDLHTQAHDTVPTSFINEMWWVTDSEQSKVPACTQQQPKVTFLLFLLSFFIVILGRHR